MINSTLVYGLFVVCSIYNIWWLYHVLLQRIGILQLGYNIL